MSAPNAGTSVGHRPGVAVGPEIASAVAALGDGALTEEGLVRHIHPLFSRVLGRKEIYLSNHSLGRPLDRTALDVARFMDLWYRDMDGAWDEWLAEQGRFRAMVAALIGCSRADAVVPRVSAGQGLRAVLDSLAGVPRVLATRGEFDSVDFILKAYQARGRAVVSFVEPDAKGMFQADKIVAALQGYPHPNLLVVSQIYYSTGQVMEWLDRVIASARQRGTLTLVDMYHAMGVIPCGFDRLAPDFAIGGNYKYTRGGPGAGWLAVNPTHLDNAPADVPPTLDTGWFAKKDAFGFQRPEQPFVSGGGDAWLESTPAIILCYQAKAGLELAIALGVERLRRYSMEQQETFVGMLRERGVSVNAPSPRGAFVLVPSIDAPGLVKTLKERGVSTDARLGQVRMCPDILNTREELVRASDIVAQAMGKK